MANNNTKTAEVLVTVRVKGIRKGMSIRKTGSRKLDSISFISFDDGLRIKAETEKKLEVLARKANLRTPFPGIYAIPEASIPEMLRILDNAEAEFATCIQAAVNNFDAIKEANKKAVEDSINGEDAKEQTRILKYFDDVVTKKFFENAKFTSAIMSSGIGKMPDIQALADRIEDSAQELYKKAVFAELAPVYEALATYYSKLSNGQDVGMKSQNFFRDKLLIDLRENNTIRRDGFTEKVVQAIEYNIDDLFEDPMICYNIVLNILEEARLNAVEDELPDLAAMEIQKLKTLTSPVYLLDMDVSEEDIPNRTPIDDMVGRVDVASLEVVE